ncbi:MAG: leucine--tRNA ligase [Candidatus Parcubacteria bacterium]|nr:leucine--tRNA ligase [Candidatus Paceibacterota bacterium]
MTSSAIQKNSKYNHRETEAKWVKQWESNQTYKTPELKTGDKKKYILEAFPYPSGDGLHVGHALPSTAGDITSRYYRLKGYKTLHPMGFDAFGLPTENFAIKKGIPPQQTTLESIKNFKVQLKKLGVDYDWTRQINTTDPNYYKWTQWLFQLLYKRGLAYKKEALVNWDPIDKTVLANEQVTKDGTAERSGAIVEQKLMSQWFFKITDYAERLLTDLDGLDWPESTKQMQRNWIGKSDGAEVEFQLGYEGDTIRVFTTAHDTIYGVTFLVISPEHTLVAQLTTEDNKTAMVDYIAKAKQKSQLERTDLNKDKSGVFTGSYAIHPLTGGQIPIWVADYVLTSYGTGAVMAVPGEDERDYEFANKYDLPVIYTNHTNSFVSYSKEIKTNKDKYTLINSGEFDGLTYTVAREKILDKLIEHNQGKAVTNYRLRDWSIGRQRYWGCPIPVYYKPSNQSKVLVIMVHGGDSTGSSEDGRQDDKITDRIVEKNQYSTSKGCPVWGENLDKVLDKEIFDVVAPVFPNAENALYSEWKRFFEQIIESQLKNNQYQDIVVIGHSLGTVFLQMYLSSEDFNERFGQKLSIIQLVGCCESEGDFEVTDNWAKIKSQVGLIKIHHSQDDSVCPFKWGQLYASKLGLASFDTYSNKGHFEQVNFEELANQLRSNFVGAKTVESLIPEQDLPLVLPNDANMTSGKIKPLGENLDFVNSANKLYGDGAQYEGDTMDSFVCSSWYFFRYLDPSNVAKFASSETIKQWMAVDQYVIGAEHSTLHLLYARFFTKVLFDEGLIDFVEPFVQMRHQGLILGPDGQKMSKSKGNTINPLEVFEQYGADTLRMYEMFMGPFDQPKPWNTDSIKGVRRLIERIWAMQDRCYYSSAVDSARLSQLGIIHGPKSERTIEKELQKLTKKIGEDIESYSFNTCISEFMKFVNKVEEVGGLTNYQFLRFLILLHPFAPFVTEEIYSQFELPNKKPSISMEQWPEFEAQMLVDTTIKYMVQVNGKVRGEFEIETNMPEAAVIAVAKESVSKWLEDKEIKFCKVVTGKLVSLVVS